MLVRGAAQVVKAVLMGVFLLTAAYLVHFAETRHLLKPAALLEQLRATAPYDEVIFVLLCALGIPVFLPDTAMNLVGALLFGAVLGTLLAWIGVFIGSVLAFYLAKFLGRDFLIRVLGERLAAVDRAFGENGFRNLLMVRLMPILPFGAVSLAAGLTGIQTRDYLLATAIGILPVTFVHQFLFARVGDTVLKNGLAWSDLKDPGVVVAVAVYMVMLVGTYAYSVWTSRTDAEPNAARAPVK